MEMTSRTKPACRGRIVLGTTVVGMVAVVVAFTG
jgi:hypothetical protein